MKPKRRKILSIHALDGDTGHGDRPWVYFMVDCFFLITEFFVVIFKFKNQDSVLPQKLPPGSRPARPNPVPSSDEQIAIHVLNNKGQVEYRFMDGQSSLNQLQQKLAALAQTGAERYAVKVSYEPAVPWGDVVAVFNACTKVEIAKCGLVPLRSDQAAGQ